MIFCLYISTQCLDGLAGCWCGSPWGCSGRCYRRERDCWSNGMNTFTRLSKIKSVIGLCFWYRYTLQLYLILGTYVNFQLLDYNWPQTSWFDVESVYTVPPASVQYYIIYFLRLRWPPGGTVTIAVDFVGGDTVFKHFKRWERETNGRNSKKKP